MFVKKMITLKHIGNTIDILNVENSNKILDLNDFLEIYRKIYQLVDPKDVSVWHRCRMERFEIIVKDFKSGSVPTIWNIPTDLLLD